MAIISNVTGAWSDAVTLSTPEFWQVQVGPVFLATAASTAPAEDSDGLLLSEEDVIALESGEVLRYRSARPDRTGVLVRRAKA